MNKYSDKPEDAYWLKELGETGWYEAWETKCWYLPYLALALDRAKEESRESYMIPV